ncbi:MAG TPA: hypothetical protein VH561_21085 [Micromonosporaceae bacterium]|jgi:hypothetical protein
MAVEVSFDPSKARTYRPSGEPKRARIVDAAPGERTTILAQWGEEEHFVGPWVAVLDDEGETVYGAAYTEFIQMHERIPETEDGWRKITKVDAYQHSGPPGRVTTVLRDGLVETTNTVRAGDWIVRQHGGEIQVIGDRVFRRLYEPDDPVQIDDVG